MYLEEMVSEARVGTVRPEGCILKVQPIGFLINLEEKYEKKENAEKIFSRGKYHG